MGKKKVKKTNEKITVWVCCVCGTKDVDIITRAEAIEAAKPKEWWEDEEDEGYTG